MTEPPDGSTVHEQDEKTVSWADEAWQAGWTEIPNLVLLEADVSATALRVYLLLLYYARQSDSAWPGQERLAEQARCSERALRTAIRELEAELLIETRRRGLGKTNIYRLLTPRKYGSGAANFADQEVSDVADPSSTKQQAKKKDTVNDADVQIVYAHWRSARDKTRATYDKISPARSQKIKMRLGEFSVDDLCKAIDGVAFDPWPERRLHDDLTIILRSREQVEKFLDIHAAHAEKPPLFDFGFPEERTA